MKFHLGKAWRQKLFHQFLKLNQIFLLHPHLKGHWWLFTSPNIFSIIFLQISLFIFILRVSASNDQREVCRPRVITTLIDLASTAWKHITWSRRIISFIITIIIIIWLLYMWHLIDHQLEVHDMTKKNNTFDYHHSLTVFSASTDNIRAERWRREVRH